MPEKIEHKDCSKIDQKIQEQKEILNLVVKRLRRNCVELLIYLILFLFVLIISTTTNKILPFCPFLLYKFFWGLGLVYLFPMRTFISIQSCFWPWLLVPYFPGGRRSRYYVHFEALADCCLSDLSCDFYLDLKLGGMAHFLWMTLPLAACLAVGAALGPTDLVALHLFLNVFVFPKRVSNILKGKGS